MEQQQPARPPTGRGGPAAVRGAVGGLALVLAAASIAGTIRRILADR